MEASGGQGAAGYRNRLDENEGYVAIKMSLNQVLKQEYSAQFRRIIFERCIVATRFQCLASLLFLFRCNSAVDNADEEFFKQNGKDVIHKCFLGVNRGNVNNPRYEVPAEFRHLVEQNGIQWPTRIGMTNSLKYTEELYTQNVKTNLRHWCYKRIKTFFIMKVYELQLQNYDFDDTDIKNALRAVFLKLDATKNEFQKAKMDFLIDELREIGGESAVHIMTLMNNYNWFKSMSMWIKIQRQIEKFHIEHNPLQFRGHIPNPPKIKNFSAVPLCNFQLKHIKIDNTELTEIATRKMKTFEKEDKYWQYDDNRPDCWSSIFDLDKIRKIGKQHKDFYYQFVSDSVSVSLMYVKKKRMTDGETQLKMISVDLNKGKIIYELGIDPGMRTYNATVRRTVKTNKEV